MGLVPAGSREKLVPPHRDSSALPYIFGSLRETIEILNCVDGEKDSADFVYQILKDDYGVASTYPVLLQARLIVSAASRMEDQGRDPVFVFGYLRQNADYLSAIIASCGDADAGLPEFRRAKLQLGNSLSRLEHSVNNARQITIYYGGEASRRVHPYPRSEKLRHHLVGANVSK